MEILYLLIPMSVVLVFVIAVLFWWSLRNGQFEDMEGPGYKILMDDDRNPEIPVATRGAGGHPDGNDTENGKTP